MGYTMLPRHSKLWRQYVFSFSRYKKVTLFTFVVVKPWHKPRLHDSFD